MGLWKKWKGGEGKGNKRGFHLSTNPFKEINKKFNQIRDRFPSDKPLTLQIYHVNRYKASFARGGMLETSSVSPLCGDSLHALAIILDSLMGAAREKKISQGKNTFVGPQK